MDEEIWERLVKLGMNPSYDFVEAKFYPNRVPCGNPQGLGDNCEETTLVPRDLMRLGLEFVVEAKGDSMIEAGIHEGDRLLIHPQETAETGDIVIVLLDQDDHCVKAYHEDEAGDVWFVPCNSKYKALKASDYQSVRILGKVVNVTHRNPRAAYADCAKIIERSLAGRGQSKSSYSAEQVRDAIHAVADRIKLNRHWFSIYRVMVDEGIILEGDYEGFEDCLKGSLGEEAPELKLRDLRSFSVGSFSKSVSLWDEDNAPVSGLRFNAYLHLAQDFKDELRRAKRQAGRRW